MISTCFNLRYIFQTMLFYNFFPLLKRITCTPPLIHSGHSYIKILSKQKHVGCHTPRQLLNILYWAEAPHWYFNACYKMSQNITLSVQNWEVSSQNILQDTIIFICTPVFDIKYSYTHNYANQNRSCQYYLTIR